MLPPPSPVSRRRFLQQFGGGLGGVALAHLLGERAAAAGELNPDFNGGLHHRARARRVIQLFMNGGASQTDLFDYKPALEQHHGQPFDPGKSVHVEAATSVPGKVLKSPFEFKQRGASGRWISSALPHLSGHVDEIAFLMAMSSATNVHGPASYLMNTGFLLPGFPSMGSWVSYGLGRLTDDLPTFVVMPDRKGFPYNQRGNFSSGFLPVTHQGTVVDFAAPDPVAFLQSPKNVGFITAEAERDGLDLLRKLNGAEAATEPSDSRLEARIHSYELAARMQLSAPETFNLKGESAATRALYGLDDPVTEEFGARCLAARRMIERGVRFVQIWSGAGGPKNNWDNHSSISKELPPMAASTDKPIAGLLTDLGALGLLDDTLVLWNTEFGRMPFSQDSEGRDHNGGAFVGWMAGAGVKPGVAHGETDEWSWKAAEGAVTTYDFNATVLHLLGIDHERLTFRYNGANRRLTDVHGKVISGVLA